MGIRSYDIINKIKIIFTNGDKKESIGGDILRASAIMIEKAEEEALEKMVQRGLFLSKDEAARAAIIKYASDLGLLSPETLWSKISKQKKRKVTPTQLMKDIEAVGNEV